MSDFTISEALHLAQLQAALVLAETGSGNSYIVLYDASAAPLATLILAKPCGTVTEVVLQLTQQEPGGDLIANTGLAAQADWFSGNGVLVASGLVTDESGTGPFILGGTAGTQLYAGGRAILGVTEIT